MSAITIRPMLPVKDWFYRRVGQAIEAARVEAGLTQRQLAERVGMSMSSIAHAEDGAGCTLLLLAMIAEALDTTADALIPLDATSRPA